MTGEKARAINRAWEKWPNVDAEAVAEMVAAGWDAHAVQVVPQPNRDVLIGAAKKAWGSKWIDRHGQRFYVPPVSYGGATEQCITATVDVVLAALSPAPLTIDREAVAYALSKVFEMGTLPNFLREADAVIAHPGGQES